MRIQKSQREVWLGQDPNISFDTISESTPQPDASLSSGATMALAASAAFEIADHNVGKLGAPWRESLQALSFHWQGFSA
ncbi:MAG: hypothetical protein WCK35_11475 [Chloroflexota bacterium]